MAEVTVDAKVPERAPYDPEAIPDAVKQRVKAVEAYYGANGKLNDSGASASQPSGSPEPAPASHPLAAPEPQVPPPPELPAHSPAPQAPAAAPASLENENSETWKHRFLAMQGRHDSSQRTIAEMQDQMTQLGNELLK